MKFIYYVFWSSLNKILPSICTENKKLYQLYLLYLLEFRPTTPITGFTVLKGSLQSRNRLIGKKGKFNVYWL